MTLRTQTKHLTSLLHALWSWLSEKRHLWFTIFVIVIAILFIIRKGVTEREIRITGLILQVGGIGTVAWGIHETRKIFGHPDIFTNFYQWLRRCPVFGRDTTGSFHINTPPITMQGRMHSSANAGPDATVEARIEALEENLKYIHERIDQTQKEITEKDRAHVQALKQERQIRVKEDQDLRGKLEATEIGGLSISAMGAAWLFVGVTMSTVSQELFLWLN